MTYRSPPPHRHMSGRPPKPPGEQRGRPNKYAPVGVEECRRAILRALVREFDGRHLSWEVATQAMALAAFDVKQTALIEIGRQETNGTVSEWRLARRTQAEKRRKP